MFQNIAKSLRRKGLDLLVVTTLLVSPFWRCRRRVSRVSEGL